MPGSPQLDIQPFAEQRVIAYIGGAHKTWPGGESEASHNDE
jgi:hypothetical protein